MAKTLICYARKINLYLNNDFETRGKCANTFGIISEAVTVYVKIEIIRFIPL